MHPILLKLGPLTVYSYGAFVALGLAVAAFLIYLRAVNFGINKDDSLDLVVLMLVAGIAGARLLYVLLNIGYYRANPSELIDLSKGGLVWYGGFFSALGASIVYIKQKKMGFWNTMDLVTPYIALGQAFGRVGCFLNGCCYGFNGIPVQLYSSFLLVIIFILLRSWQDRRRFKGEIALGYCILYSLKRFGVEFLRGDNPRVFLGLTISQVISLVVIILVVPIFMKKVSEWKEKDTVSK
ncbi:MAG: prolipoprotein diacylglyceryl transferase [Candidatus Omnitrophica bacterium]|nr:prolipoprotein diacylglyceryl transferase [Candidatus Omnitrophota bacterium]